MKKKRVHKFQLFIFAAFWLILVVMFTGMIVVQMSRYNYYRSDLVLIQQELAQEVQINEDLLNQQAYYESDAYVEQLARDQMGYVKPNEIVIVTDSE